VKKIEKQKKEEKRKEKNLTWIDPAGSDGAGWNRFHNERELGFPRSFGL
jgi:hypothetical protein